MAVVLEAVMLASRCNAMDVVATAEKTDMQLRQGAVQAMAKFTGRSKKKCSSDLGQTTTRH